MVWIILSPKNLSSNALPDNLALINHYKDGCKMVPNIILNETILGHTATDPHYTLQSTGQAAFCLFKRETI